MAAAPDTHLYGIVSDRSGTLVIGGRGVCLISRDKGRSWENARFSPHIEYSWVYALASPAPSCFVAAGENGAIYHGGLEGFNRVDY